MSRDPSQVSLSVQHDRLPSIGQQFKFTVDLPETCRGTFWQAFGQEDATEIPWDVLVKGLQSLLQAAHLGHDSMTTTMHCLLMNLCADVVHACQRFLSVAFTVRTIGFRCLSLPKQGCKAAWTRLSCVLGVPPSKSGTGNVYDMVFPWVTEVSLIRDCVQEIGSPSKFGLHVKVNRFCHWTGQAILGDCYLLVGCRHVDKVFAWESLQHLTAKQRWECPVPGCPVVFKRNQAVAVVPLLKYSEIFHRLAGAPATIWVTQEARIFTETFPSKRKHQEINPVTP